MHMERRHFRKIAIRRLSTVFLLCGFLSFLFGTWIVPWVLAAGIWLLHHLPWQHQPPGHFPNLLTFIATPNFALGFIWLAYYLITFIWGALTLSPRQKAAIRATIEREPSREWSFSGSFSHQQQAETPLSQAWPGELKHQLVEHCYETYRKALLRFDPPPLELRTPPTFFYRKTGDIEWRGTLLILPEAVLTPERIHELLPFLAHFLFDYNTEQITSADTGAFPDHAPPLAGLLFVTGNFLWLAVIYKHGIEDDAAARTVAQEHQRIFDRDAFAVLLGQGPALEHQLRRVEDALKQQGKPDTNSPTLIERIGHLEVLNKQEHEEMRALGLTPKEPPLVADEPLQQLDTQRPPSS